MFHTGEIKKTHTSKTKNTQIKSMVFLNNSKCNSLVLIILTESLIVLKRIIPTCCLLLFILSHSTNAQRYPLSVFIDIPAIPQETHVWCWAAVAQQVVFAIHGNNTPPQCAIVSIANNENPGTCCDQLGRWNGNQNCLVPGNLNQIQSIIFYFGGRYSSIEFPTDPLTIYNTLQNNRPIIMFVKQSAFQQIGHFVVIVGMEWIPTQFGFQPVLYVNDPMNFVTKPIPFADIARFWQSSIVVN